MFVMISCFKRVLTVLLSLVFIFLLSAQSFYAVSQDVGEVKNCKNICFDCNSNGAFLYGRNGNTVYTTMFSNGFSTRNFTHTGKFKAVIQSNIYTYAFYETNLKKGEFAIVGINNRSGTQQEFYFSGFDATLRTNTFSVTDKYVYFIMADGVFANVFIYNTEGSFITKLCFNSNANLLFNNSGNTYVLLANGKIFLLNNTSSKYITTVQEISKIYNCGSGWIGTDRSQLISLADCKVYDNAYEIGKVTLFNKYMVSLQNENLLLSLAQDKDRLALYSNSKAVKYLLSYKDDTYIVYQDFSYKILALNDYGFYSDIAPSTSNTINTPPDKEPATYFVNNDIIYGIPSGTTVLNFKNSFEAVVVLTDENGSAVTSGIIKTGQIAVIDDKKYKLSVVGDITKEGNIKSNDVDSLCSYLLNKIKLDELQKISADINQDGVTNNIDLVLMSRKASKESAE